MVFTGCQWILRFEHWALLSAFDCFLFYCLNINGAISIVAQNAISSFFLKKWLLNAIFLIPQNWPAYSPDLSPFNYGEQWRHESITTDAQIWMNLMNVLWIILNVWITSIKNCSVLLQTYRYLPDIFCSGRCPIDNLLWHVWKRSLTPIKSSVGVFSIQMEGSMGYPLTFQWL